MLRFYHDDTESSFLGREGEREGGMEGGREVGRERARDREPPEKTEIIFLFFCFVCVSAFLVLLRPGDLAA